MTAPQNVLGGGNPEKRTSVWCGRAAKNGTAGSGPLKEKKKRTPGPGPVTMFRCAKKNGSIRPRGTKKKKADK